ncbi:MAG: hypothetical protein KJ890_07285 [Gammaproteobacteria bacterium]|nr:hypothetical protein [Gammaproteobacteria bacterium]MBU0792244.1 hypothetical protein [Gammaproteobacteria bacterium]MBU1805253.1 hypothetical protein [Gammaproteobacteria bacterium]
MLYLTALSLPRRGTYIALHTHKSPARLHWAGADRDNYLDFLTRIEKLYSNGPAGLGLPRPLLEAVYDSSLTPLQATNRILPLYLTCPPGSVDRSYLLSPAPSDVEILGIAGGPGEPHGLRLAVIAKGADRLQLKRSVLDRAADIRGSEFSTEELSTIEGRSAQEIVRAVSEADDEAAELGAAKIVAIPAEAKVVLARNAKGEFVREVARTWA